jgi:hypothetical protein
MKTKTLVSLSAVLVLAGSLAPVSAQTTILSESFEGAFPGTTWTVGDDNPAGTPAYWKDVFATFGGEDPHTGAWKGYCAGIGYGGDEANPNYQDYMAAYMQTTLDLRNVNSATLTFWSRMPGIEQCCDAAKVFLDGSLVWSSSNPQAAGSEVAVNLNAYVGGVHTLRFEFDSDQSVTYEGWYLDDILVTGVPVPANDQCAGAIGLSDNVPFSMDTRNATSPGDPSPTCQANCGRGVWFTYAPALDGFLFVETCGSSFDTVLELFTGSCGLLQPVSGGCNDDSGAHCGTQSYVMVPVTAGTTYFIMAGGFAGASGRLQIKVLEYPGPWITSGPTDATVQCGGNAQFEVTAIGPPPIEYQWRKDDVPIPGATNALLVVSNVNRSMDGAVFRVEVHNAHGATSANASLHVIDTIPPSITCPTNLTVQCLANVPPRPTTLAQFLAQGGLASDNCGIVAYSCWDSAPMPGPQSAVIQRTHFIVDARTNTASCVQTITLQDALPPVVVCPSNLVVYADYQECTKPNVTYTATATDNCPGVTVQCHPPSGSTFSNGVTVVTCTATDAAGNTNVCQFTVTVLRPTLRYTQLDGGWVQLEWPEGNLQAGSYADGYFMDVPGSTSPYVVAAVPGGYVFRTRAPYSSNLVGYVSIALAPGYSLIANPLLTPNNTVGSLLSNMPNGVSVFPYPFSSGANSCLNGWHNPSLPLTPGTGCLVHNPYPTNLPVLWVGNVFTGNSAVTFHNGQWAIASSVLPLAGWITTNLGWPAVNGDTIYTLGPGGFWEDHDYLSQNWIGGEPCISLGEAFVYRAERMADWTWGRPTPFVPPPCGLTGSNWTEFPTYHSAGESYGTVNFFTFHPNPALGRVYDADGVTPVSSGFSAQLYAGGTAIESALQPVGTPQPFLAGSGAGYVRASNVLVSNVPPGAQCYLQFRVWEDAGGSSYKSAAATPAKVGKSALFSVTLNWDVALRPPDNASEFPSFRVRGVEPLCTDCSVLPAGSVRTGDAYLGSDGSLHLTDAMNYQQGTFLLPVGRPLGSFRAAFKALVGDSSSANPADGFSFCFGSDLSSSCDEEGSGTGLIVSFDTFDNGHEEAPCIDLKWNGLTFAHAPKRLITGTPAAFVDVFIELTSAGQVTVCYAGATVHNAVPIPGYSPISGDAWLGLGARTGSLNAKHWIDDLCINDDGAGAPPRLTIGRLNATVIASWPLPDSGWKLHATTNLVATGSVWTEIPPPYATNTASLYFVEPAPAGNKFYRLHHP